MAEKKKSTSTKKASTTKVTRIKATDTKPAAINQTPPKKNKLAKKDETTKAKVAKAASPKVPKSTPAFLRPFIALGIYFKGAWEELKQVRWPTRRATWGLTGAVLLFTAFFVAFILLLDGAFKYLFELILR